MAVGCKRRRPNQRTDEWACPVFGESASISAACGSSSRQGHKQELRLFKKNLFSGTALCKVFFCGNGPPAASDEVQRDFSVEERKPLLQPRVYHEPSFLSRASPFLPPEWFLSHALEFLRT